METLFFKNPLLRYYTAYTYQHQAESPLLIRMHSNKLFLLFLHPDHPAMKQKILNISYKFSTDSLSGKRKKGAVTLQANTNLIEIKTESETYVVKSGIPGKLIEINDILLNSPEFIKNEEGFIAIVMPPLNKIDNILKTLTKLS